ncbi:D-inositol-3-phosphate glycosyltransferase [Methylobacterium thuringiense]|uniref:D-inositol-3-phosphate glycosyltransferase n=1 Tax=Methylobacterium thuringiense TaxID=1003091 RepID=A0ABQ4TRD0_9HYPH|nr:D-inositol-3-phosphate glycosyltransferase [Methylobacterium thuringiense]
MNAFPETEGSPPVRRPPRSVTGTILIIVENLPVPFDRRVWQEACALRDAGAKVSVICPQMKGYDRPYEVLDGIEIHRHPLTEAASSAGYVAEYGTAFFHQTRLAWTIFRKRRFDVIHACNPPDLIFLVAFPFKLLGVKFVFDHHDICPELFEAKFDAGSLGARAVRQALLTLERLTFAAADASIATNESYRRIAVERGGMRPDRVAVVRSGPDLTRLKRGERDPALLKGRDLLVAYVGVIGNQEGLDLLIDAIRHLVTVRGRTDTQFCIVGAGPALHQAQQYAEESGVSAYVDFLGRVPDDKLISVLSTADVGVNPDRVNAMNDKSTMNKILEYMAFSLPIVQFDVTEGRASAGEASLYAAKNDPMDLASKMDLLLSEPDRRQRMGALGYERVCSQFAWNHQAATLTTFYADLLERPEKRSWIARIRRLFRSRTSIVEHVN